MYLNFEYLRVFCAVARHGVISRAAEELHLSQPTVTIEMRKLEQLIGMKLFSRHPRGITLTPEGKYLYQRISPAIETLSGAESELERLSSLETGVIRVSYNNNSTFHSLHGFAAQFAELHPGVTVYPSIVNRGSARNALNSGTVDLVLAARPALNPVPAPTDSASNGEALPAVVEYSLGVFPDVLLCHRHLGELCGRTVTAQDLSAYPFIFRKPSDDFGRVYDDFGRNYYADSIPRSPEMTAKDLFMDDPDAVCSVLRISDYVAVIPYLTALSVLGDSEFAALSTTLPPVKTEYLLHYSKAHPPSYAAVKLMDFLLQQEVFSPKEITPTL